MTSVGLVICFASSRQSKEGIRRDFAFNRRARPGVGPFSSVGTCGLRSLPGGGVGRLALPVSSAHSLTPCHDVWGNRRFPVVEGRTRAFVPTGSCCGHPDSTTALICCGSNERRCFMQRWIRNLLKSGHDRRTLRSYRPALESLEDRC